MSREGKDRKVLFGMLPYEKVSRLECSDKKTMKAWFVGETKIRASSTMNMNLFDAGVASLFT